MLKYSLQLSAANNRINMVSECFQLNAFILDYCDLKIKVFYIYLQHYGTTQSMRPNCINFQILLDCIVLSIISK